MGETAVAFVERDAQYSRLPGPKPAERVACDAAAKAPSCLWNPTMILRLLLFAVIGFLGFQAYSDASAPPDPALERTDRFEERFHATGNYPFLARSLWLAPQTLEPGQVYPLVLVLHGASEKSVAAKALAEDFMRQQLPAFVLMPIAPNDALWWTYDAAGRLQPSGAMEFAISLVEDAIAGHPVDAERVYVVGHSNGATGTFLAMARYPALFAAGVAVNGDWFDADAAVLANSRLAIWHGTEDPVFPIENARSLVSALRLAGGKPLYQEMKGVGHDGRPAFDDWHLWQWLFAQR